MRNPGIFDRERKNSFQKWLQSLVLRNNSDRLDFNQTERAHQKKMKNRITIGNKKYADLCSKLEQVEKKAYACLGSVFTAKVARAGNGSEKSDITNLKQNRNG